MTKTKFDKKHSEFSNKAHEAAKVQIYPVLFNNHKLEFESTLMNMGERGRILDGEMAIDRVVKIIGNRGDVPFTIQERFRKPQYAKFKDITITLFNHASGMHGELYKLGYCSTFVYGFYDESKDSFIDWVAVNVPALMFAIAKGDLKYTTHFNEKQQEFICIKFEDLEEKRLLHFWANKKTAI